MTTVHQGIELPTRAAVRHTWPRGWLLRRALLGADIAGLLVTFAITQAVFGHLMNRNPGVAVELGLFVLTLPIWIVLAKLYGLYDRDETRTDQRSVDDLLGVFQLTTIATWVIVAASRLTHAARPDLDRVTAFWGISIVAIIAARSVARAICRRHESYLQNTLVVGAGPVGRMLARKLEQNAHYGLRLVGFVDDDPGRPVPGFPDTGVVCSFGDLPRAVQQWGVGRVIMAFPSEEHETMLEMVRELSQRDVQVDVVPTFYDLFGQNVDVHTAGGIPVWSIRPLRLSRSALLLKRLFDTACSAVGLLLLAPLFLVVAIAVKLDSPGPVLFRQRRIGAGQREFALWKFRTMVADAEERKQDVAHLNSHARDGGDARMFKIEHDPRVTRVGRMLRRFYLDELPQLANVLRGEMSLVGPRPLIPDEHRHVTSWRQRRLDLKPGITGLWQVNGGSQAPFEEMVALDYRYVTNWSLWHDLEIMLRTIPLVARGNAVEG